MKRHRTVREAADELLDDLGRVGFQLLRRAARDHFAARQQEYLIRDGGDLLHIVRDDDAGDAQRIVQAANQTQNDAQ